MAEQLSRSMVDLVPGSAWQPSPPRSRYALRVDLAAAAERTSPMLPISTAPCRARAQGEWSALWLGPDEQLLLGPAQGAAEFAAAAGKALAGLAHSLVDVSHRQGAIELGGAHAAAIINSGCPLDLRESSFPVDACTRTVFGKAEIVLWRQAPGRFHIEIWRSFMPYVAGLLAEAEREYPP